MGIGWLWDLLEDNLNGGVGAGCFILGTLVECFESDVSKALTVDDDDEEVIDSLRAGSPWFSLLSSNCVVPPTVHRVTGGRLRVGLTDGRRGRGIDFGA